MSTNPYENEPGFEDANEASDKKNQKDYVQKVRHPPHTGSREY
jgi:ubiquitin-conjugating enzyme E2 Z